MKSVAHRNGNQNATLSPEIADELIREVSESVISGSLSVRRHTQEQERTFEAPVITQPPVLRPERTHPPETQTGTALAIINYSESDSAIGQYLNGVLPHLAASKIDVHHFGRFAPTIRIDGVQYHNVGACENSDLMSSVEEFTLRVLRTFRQVFGSEGDSTGSTHSDVSLLGHEWTAIPAMRVLGRTQHTLLSLHSLECQRSDMSSHLSQRIQEIEIQGLKDCNALLIHNVPTATDAQRLQPECASKLVQSRTPFPQHEFESTLDAGEVKARYQIGPVDPTILFIGDLDERHGPDVLMRSIPRLIKGTPQVRFIFVGEGTLQWPLRVHSRYLLLDYAIRITGHIGGQALRELIAAADIIAIPSRERTEDWTLLAAWSAGRPVVASHNAAGDLIQHEKDGVLVYPHESSLIWGIERLLNDHAFRASIGAAGKSKVSEKYGWKDTTVQLCTLAGIKK